MAVAVVSIGYTWTAPSSGVVAFLALCGDMTQMWAAAEVSLGGS